MTPEELKQYTDELAKQFGKQTSEEIKKQVGEVEAKMNEAAIKRESGLMTTKQFDAFKEEAIKPLNESLKKLDTIEKAAEAQGTKINQLIEGQKTRATDIKNLSVILEERKDELKKIYRDHVGFIEIPLKSAGLTSIAGSVQPMAAPPTSPYAPGIGGPDLTIYDIIRNPAFVSNYVTGGTTNQARYAWINETSLQGSAGQVTEGNQKPETQHIYQVEFSQAKKIASYIQLTEEFDQDLPGLSADVQRLLGVDVLRVFDDTIQQDVINAATPFAFTAAGGLGGGTQALKGTIFDATIWDALLAMGVQVRLNNFVPNVSMVNPVSFAKLMMGKDTVGRYNYPSDAFVAAVNAQQGNKITPDFAIVGDLTQYNIRIYKDFILKIGWINDDLIRNQFTIVGEVRFHSFIPTARKVAIVYGEAKWIAEQMNSASGALTGS